MDPDVAWHNMLDPIWDLGTRILNGYDLLGWLERGGFCPTELHRIAPRRMDAIREVKLWINSLEARK